MSSDFPMLEPRVDPLDRDHVIEARRSSPETVQASATAAFVTVALSEGVALGVELDVPLEDVQTQEDYIRRAIGALQMALWELHRVRLMKQETK